MTGKSENQTSSPSSPRAANPPSLPDASNAPSTANPPSPERHPFEPFLPPNAKILMLGTFPPPEKRWSMPFYYPNFINDMWRIVGLVFFDNRDHFIKGKRFDERMLREFCAEKGIALSDTAQEVIRLQDNASDKFLEITEPADIASMLAKIPRCRAIVTTGQKATDTLIRIVRDSGGEVEEPSVGASSEFNFDGRKLRLYRMPSSSRAYPKPLIEKAAIYAEMFCETGLL